MSAVTSVYRNVRGLRTAIRDVGRLRQITTILARHGFGALMARMQLGDLIGVRSSVAEETTPMARRLRLAFEELGPTFVKLGQILSTRADIVGAETATELQHLQDAVPPMPWPEVELQLHDALRRPITEVFSSVDPQPLGSASIAQVHRATLVSGGDVVLKVLRRGVRDLVERDLSILHFLAARAQDLVPELSVIDPVGIVSEFERALDRELSLNQERQHIERFRQNFAGFEGLHIPEVFPEHCSDSLLVMELIKGVKVTDAQLALGADPYVLAPRMIKALLKMIFADGFFHGDLHPGNVLIRNDQTICLIDFGLVGRLLPQQREDVLTLMVGIAREDYELISRTMFDIGHKVPGVEYDYIAFEQDVIDVVERHLAGKTLSDVDVQAVFSDLVAGAVRHQIRMPPSYTLVFKALMTVEGIGKTLVPSINFIEESKPFITDMMKARYSPERLTTEAIDTLSATSRFARRFAQLAPRVLREMEQGRLAIKIESRLLEQLVAEERKSSLRGMRVTLFVGSTVVAAILNDAPGPHLGGLHIGAVLALALATVSALPLVFDLFRRD